jgi:hypothetical protein
MVFYQLKDIEIMVKLNNLIGMVAFYADAHATT